MLEESVCSCLCMRQHSGGFPNGTEEQGCDKSSYVKLFPLYFLSPKK